MSSSPSRVWFLLVDFATGQPYKNTSVSSVLRSSLVVPIVVQFRDAAYLENSSILTGIAASQLVVYKNKSSFDKRNAAVGEGKEEPLELDTPVDGLGTSMKEALIVVVPSDIPIAIAPQAASSSAASTLSAVQKRPLFRFDGVSLGDFHLPRTHLVEKLTGLVKREQFVLIASPPASGKTSLLKIFTKHEPSYNFVPLSFHDSSRTAMQILAEAGIDLHGNFLTRKSPDIPPNTVVLIDDVQTKYGEDAFWSKLIKVSLDWLPETIRFVFAATYLIVDVHESPAEFTYLARLTRDDLLLQREEFDELIRSVIGLEWNFQKETLMDMIWHQCGRLVGAVRYSIEAINDRFLKDENPSESDLSLFYLTFDVSDPMARCFGSLHSSPVSQELKEFLAKCYFNEQQPVPQLVGEDKNSFVLLKKCGILLECPVGGIEFSSPMAKRFYERYLFPGNSRPRSLEFDSLRSLMLGAIQKFSRAAIRNSLASGRFPKEALFQQQLMNSLLQCLPITHKICPDLSERFPTAASAKSQTISGEIDFYIDGDLRYGIELLVEGKEIVNQMSRFSSNGKYAPLEVNDYVVVDFRSGPISEKIARHAKRMTVFFMDQYASCQCVYGMEPDVISLTLEP